MKQPTIETSLSVLGFDRELDFLDIARRMRRNPDTTRSINHLTAAGTVPPSRVSAWTITTGPRTLASVDEGVRMIFASVAEGLTDLRRLCEKQELAVKVVSRVIIYDWQDRPFYELTSDTVQQLAMVGASWELDLSDRDR